METNKIQQLTGFSTIQKLVLNQYENGEHADISSIHQLENYGDGLLEFLVKEAGDSSDFAEFAKMLESSINQLSELKYQILLRTRMLL